MGEAKVISRRATLASWAREGFQYHVPASVLIIVVWNSREAEDWGVRKISEQV